MHDRAIRIARHIASDDELTYSDDVVFLARAVLGEYRAARREVRRRRAFQVRLLGAMNANARRIIGETQQRAEHARRVLRSIDWSQP